MLATFTITLHCWLLRFAHAQPRAYDRLFVCVSVTGIICLVSEVEVLVYASMCINSRSYFLGFRLSLGSGVDR